MLRSLKIYIFLRWLGLKRWYYWKRHVLTAPERRSNTFKEDYLEHRVAMTKGLLGDKSWER